MVSWQDEFWSPEFTKTHWKIVPEIRKLGGGVAWPWRHPQAKGIRRILLKYDPYDNDVVNEVMTKDLFWVDCIPHDG